MNKSCNETGTEWCISTGATTFLVTFTLLQTFVGLLPNFIVIITISIARELRRRSEDLLILNLAICDFLSLTVFLPWQAYVLSLRKTSSSHLTYESVLTLYTSCGANSMLAIAIDRFVAVVLPLRHRAIMTRRTTYTMAVLSWGTAVAFAIAFYLSNEFKFRQYQDILLTAYGLFVLLFIAVIYTIIFYCTSRQAKRNLNQRRSIRVEWKNNSARLLAKITLNTFMLVCLFYATYFPLIIYIIHSSFVTQPPPIIRTTIRSWIYSFMFLNSCVNPFIYTLRTKRFKKAFYRKIWSKIFHRPADQESPIPRELSAPT